MATWLPKTSDERLPFGIDISKYQGLVDYGKLAEFDTPSVEFMGIRSTISWGYQDPFFKRNWQEAKNLGINRVNYHVLYPGEDVKRQVDNIMLTLDGDLGEGPVAIDAELDHDYSKTKITDSIEEMVFMLRDETGRLPCIYTRPSWVLAHMTPRNWFAQVPWWMATYTWTGQEHNGNGVKEASEKAGVPGDMVWVHQTGDKGKGPVFGMKSLGLDYNRWFSTPEHYSIMFGDVIVSPPPQPTITVEVRVPGGVEVVVTEL